MIMEIDREVFKQSCLDIADDILNLGVAQRKLMADELMHQLEDSFKFFEKMGTVEGVSAVMNYRTIAAPIRYMRLSLVSQPPNILRLNFLFEYKTKSEYFKQVAADNAVK